MRRPQEGARAAARALAVRPGRARRDFIATGRPGRMGKPRLLLAGLKKGRRGDIARAISMVENGQDGSGDLAAEVFAHTGNATVIGFTGPAGAGKSTLIDRVAVELRGRGAAPAVLAVDPSSHVTGGAILGDRVRMSRSAESGTYIRSVASRGAAGAVARSVRGIVRILEYAGFDPILVESVGAGQTEVGISAVSDITVVVFSPQTGDSIQAVKAGLTEIGDMYVVNKGDLDGAEQLYGALLDHVAGGGGGRAAGEPAAGGAPAGGAAPDRPAVAMASAKSGRGTGRLAATLLDMARRGGAGEKKAAEDARLEAEVRDIVLNMQKERLERMLDPSSNRSYAGYLRRVRAREIDPHEAARRFSARLALRGAAGR